jgi:hypothetical protein
MRDRNLSNWRVQWQYASSVSSTIQPALVHVLPRPWPIDDPSISQDALPARVLVSRRRLQTWPRVASSRRAVAQVVSVCGTAGARRHRGRIASHLHAPARSQVCRASDRPMHDRETSLFVPMGAFLTLARTDPLACGRQLSHTTLTSTAPHSKPPLTHSKLLCSVLWRAGSSLTCACGRFSCSATPSAGPTQSTGECAQRSHSPHSPLTMLTLGATVRRAVLTIADAIRSAALHPADNQ